MKERASDAEPAPTTDLPPVPTRRRIPPGEAVDEAEPVGALAVPVLWLLAVVVAAAALARAGWPPAP